jgi:hypothetical protein
MKPVSALMLALVGMALVGCRAARPAGDYTGIAKHPLHLHLSGNGSYSTEYLNSSEPRGEHGRWYRIEDDVVMLVPDDATRPPWFARVAEKLLLMHSEDARKVLRP